MTEIDANTNESIDGRERDFMEYVTEKVGAKGKDPLVNNVKL